MNNSTTIPPTERQIEVVRHILGFSKAKGYPPSVRDISDLMGGISTNAVHGHLDALMTKGLVNRHPKVARSLTVTQLGSSLAGIR